MQAIDPRKQTKENLEKIKAIELDTTVLDLLNNNDGTIAQPNTQAESTTTLSTHPLERFPWPIALGCTALGLVTGLLIGWGIG